METTLAPTQQAVTQVAGQNSVLLQAKPEEHIATSNKEDVAAVRTQLDSISKTLETLADTEKGKATKSILEKKSFGEKFEKFFYEGPKWFQWFRENFCLYLNSFGIAFNTIAVIATNSSFFSEKTAKFLDEKSESFAKYIIPFSFGWNGIEAWMGKRPLETISRLIPATLFWVLPFYNLNLATGISSGLNYLFEHVKDRFGGKNPGEGDRWKNTTETLKTSLDVLKDIFKGDHRKEDFPKQLATMFLLAGSFGGFAFARNSRDSVLARLFGNMRNIGGIIADWKLVFNNDPDPKRQRELKIVGGSCSIASILNILMRWVDTKLGRALTHISIAADDFGLTYWAQSSKRDNDIAQKNKHAAELEAKSNLQARPELERVDLHKVEQAAPEKSLAI